MDTVRYNRDEFGLKLHVPPGWTGTPALLYPGPKDSIRAVPLTRIDATDYRARYKPDRTFRYAFWLGATKFKTGTTGPILDANGVHDTLAPSWFTQNTGDYPDHKSAEWPSQGCILYALNPETFGDGTPDQRGAMSLEKNAAYLASLSATGLWFVGGSAEAADGVEIAKRSDARVIGEGAVLPHADGVAAASPPAAKGLWRVLITNSDAHAALSESASDTVLDYRWADIVKRFIREGDALPSDFRDALQGLWSDYPDAAAAQMVMRWGGPNRPRPSLVFGGDPKKLLQAWVLLFTLPGVPLFDTGDEVGSLEPDEKMVWDATVQNTVLRDQVKLLAALRLARRSLYRGDFNVLMADDDQHVFAFIRTDRMETTVVVMNNSDMNAAIHLPLGGLGTAGLTTLFGTQAFTPNGGDLSLTISAHGIAIIGN